MIEEELYKKLQGFKLLAAGCLFELQYDKTRRCFRLYQKAKNFGIYEEIGSRILQSFLQEIGNTKLPHYFEKINKSFPLNSYILLDARALDILLKSNLLKTAAFSAKDDKTSVGGKINVSVSERKNEVGEKEACYILPKNLRKNFPTFYLHPAEQKCVYKTPQFAKKHIILTPEMAALVMRLYQKNFDGDFYQIFDRKCRITCSQDRYKITQLNQKNVEEDVDLELFHFLSSAFQNNLPFEDNYDENSIIVNEARWQEAYAQRLTNDPSFYNPLKKIIAEEKVEAEEISKELGNKIAIRIWRDQENRYAAYIDNAKNIFIFSKEGKENILAFKKYLQSEAYLRRAKHFSFPLFPSWIREFVLLKKPKSALKNLVEGVNDITSDAVSFANVTKSQFRPTGRVQFSAEGLAIFPIFLSLIKIGIESLDDEKHNAVEQLSFIKIKIAQSEIFFKNFLSQKTFHQENLEECFDLIRDLTASIKALNSSEVRCNAPSYYGYPGILLAFLATVSNEMNAILNLGISSTVDPTDLSKQSPQFLYQGSKEVMVVINSLTLAAQALMICYAANMSYLSFRDLNEAQLSKEIKKINNSPELSNFVKKTLKRIKRDELFYKKCAAANSCISLSGQVSMALSSPLLFAFSPTLYLGLSLHFSSVVIGTVLNHRQAQKYSYDNKKSATEQLIAGYYAGKMLKLVLSKINKSASAKFLSEREILREQSHSIELFSHLSAVALATNKVLKECYKNSTYDVDLAIQKSATHYRSRNYQKSLGSFLEAMNKKNKSRLNRFVAEANGENKLAFMTMWHQHNQALMVSEADGQFIIELGQILAKLNSKNLSEIRCKIYDSSEIPQRIKSEILATSFEVGANVKDNKEKLILAIQNSYMSYKLKNMAIDFSKNSGKQPKKDKEELIIDLTKSFLKAPFAEKFKSKILHQKYDQENRKNFFHNNDNKKHSKYKDTDQIIEIIGKVHKKGGTGSVNFPHDKNVYAFREEALETDCYLPSEGLLQDTLFSESKFELRSRWFNSLYDSAEVVKQVEVLKKVKELNSLREKITPTNDYNKWWYSKQYGKGQDVAIEMKRPEKQPVTSIRTTLFSPLISYLDNIWSSTQRLNKFKVANDIQPQKKLGLVETFIEIIEKVATNSNQTPLNREQIAAIIKTAKQRGGIYNKLDEEKVNYLSPAEIAKNHLPQDIRNSHGKIIVSATQAQKFSAAFQKECKSRGILSGRDGGKEVGLRTTFIPDYVLETLENESNETRRKITFCLAR